MSISCLRNDSYLVTKIATVFIYDCRVCRIQEFFMHDVILLASEQNVINFQKHTREVPSCETKDNRQGVYENYTLLY